MKQLMAIIRKNLLMLARSKVSTIVILLGPLLLVVLLGMGVQSRFLHVQIGYHLPEDSAVFTGILEQFSEQNFEYRSFHSSEDCINSVKRGYMHMCILFDQNQTDIYVDVSKTNLAYAILQMVSERFDESSQQISTEIMRDVFSRFYRASQVMENKSQAVQSMQQEIGTIPLRLQEIQEGLGRFSIDMKEVQFEYDFSEKRDEIDEYRDLADEQYVLNKERLRNISEEIEESKASLLEKKRQRDQYLEEIEYQMDVYGCDAKSYIDISPYIEEDRPIEFGVHDPTCSALYTTKVQLLVNTRDIDENIEMLEEMEEMVADAREDLEEYRDILDDAFDEAEEEIEKGRAVYATTTQVFSSIRQKLHDIEAFRKDMSVELEMISGMLDSSIVWMQDMEDTLGTLSEDFASMQNHTISAIIDPLSTSVHPTHYTENRLQHFFPSLLIMILSFTCILLTGLITVREKNSKAFFRNSIMPLKRRTLLLGALLSVAFVALVQAAIIYALSRFVFSVGGLEDIVGISLVVVFGCVLFNLIGILVGILMHSEESTVLTGIILSLLLFVFSGMVVPLENLTNLIYGATQANPFVLMEGFLKNVMVYNIPLFNETIVIYVVEVFLLAVVSLLLFEKRKSSN